MYNCQVCNTPSGPRQPLRRHLVYRPRVYASGSEGVEIAREIPVCSSCWALLQSGVPFSTLVRQRGKALIPGTTAPAPAPKIIVDPPPRPVEVVRMPRSDVYVPRK